MRLLDHCSSLFVSQQLGSVAVVVRSPVLATQQFLTTRAARNVSHSSCEPKATSLVVVPKRRGQRLDEFLSEQAVVNTIVTDGNTAIAILTGLPRPLRDGKTVDRQFVADCKFKSLFVLEGHPSIHTTHLIWN